MKNKWYLIGTIAVVLIGALIAQNWKLLILAPVAFVQNMAFTASSRSRNSGNPEYHFWIACMSNSVWFITSFFLILSSVKDATFFEQILTLLVYTASTSYGSALMMELMIKKETGKNKPGA